MGLICALLFLTLVSFSVADIAVDDLKTQIISEVKRYFDEELELLKQKHDSEKRELDAKLASSQADIAHLKSQNEILAQKLENTLLLVKRDNQFMTKKQPWKYLRKYRFHYKGNSLHTKEAQDVKYRAFPAKQHIAMRNDEKSHFINEENLSAIDINQHQLAEKSRRQVNTPLPAGSGVAFLAVLNNQHLNTNPNQSIVFDKVVTNIGGSFNSSSGLFVAPIPGVYVFSFSILARGQHAHVKLVKNGQIIARVNLHDWNESSQFVVLQLNKGDDVAIRNDDISGINFHGELYTSFAGFLIYDYTDVASVVVGK